MAFANAQEELDAWLSTNEYELETELFVELPDGFPYDFDRDSLAELEQVILGEFETRDALRDPEHNDFIDRLARYIGETIIRGYPDSRWIPGGPNYNDLPVVQVPDGTDLPVSPFQLITVAVVRRTGNELTRVFDGVARTIARHSADAEPQA